MIIDLIIVAIIAICIFLGYKRGLIGVAFKLLSLVIAIILAVLLHGPISNFIINNTTIDEKIEQTIAEKLDLSQYENKDNEEIKEVKGNLPQVLIKNLEKSANNVKEDIEKTVAKKLAETILSVGIFIILFIVIKIILIVINIVGDVISKLPVIKQLDKTGGVIYGILEGLIIVYIILALCLMLAPFMQSSGILEYINSSFIGNILYNNNILLKFIR